MKNAPYCDKQKSEDKDLFTVALDLKEIRDLISAMKAWRSIDRVLIAFIEDSINKGININILCRPTKDSYNKTIEQLKGE